MKRVFTVLVLVVLLTSVRSAQATIPTGYATIFDWINQITTDINIAGTKLQNYYEDWASLPASVKTGIKTRVNAKIDQAIQRLTDLKTDVNAL